MARSSKGLKSSQSESSLQPHPLPTPSSGQLTHQPSLPQIRDKLPLQQSYSQAPSAPAPLPLRSPERPLAQCQVKPMPKASPRDSGFSSSQTNGSSINSDYEKKTDFSKTQQIDDFVPTPMNRPAGLTINDFLPVRNHYIPSWNNVTKELSSNY